ncbi:15927_t:CDS:1, partial [Funneliformis geosporum]
DIELSTDKQPSSPNDDADRETHQEFLSRKVLIIRNVSMYNPLKLLTKVFSEYDHMVCMEITMRGRLGITNQFVTLSKMDRIERLC